MTTEVMHDKLMAAIDKEMKLYERATEKGEFRKKDYDKKGRLKWKSDYAELRVAQIINADKPTTLYVPTLVMNDATTATTCQMRLGCDMVRFTKHPRIEGRYHYDVEHPAEMMGIDVKLQDDADYWGTINVEWSLYGSKWSDSTIHWSRASYYCYVNGDDAYILDKRELKKIAEELPDSFNRDNRNKITKRVSLDKVKEIAKKHYSMGLHYHQEMLKAEELQGDIYAIPKRRKIIERLTNIEN